MLETVASRSVQFTEVRFSFLMYLLAFAKTFIAQKRPKTLKQTMVTLTGPF